MLYALSVLRLDLIGVPRCLIDRHACTCRPMKNSLGRDGIKELVKVVVNAKDDKVLGFHMVGSEASEILQVRRPWPAPALSRRGQAEQPITEMLGLRHLGVYNGR